VLALVVFVWAGAVQAASGLYTAQVPVASQGDAERAEALKAALGQVMVRVSGDASVLTRRDVAKALDQAERYVQQFQYQQDVVTEGGQPQVRLTLVAQFDRDAVDQLLHVPGAAVAEPVPGEAAPPAEVAAPGTYHLWVGGVRSAQDYARVIGAFSGNEFVRDVQVELARGDGLQLRVASTVALPRVLDLLNAGGVVHVANAKPPIDGIDALLDVRP
jgi:hypothetical protein